MKSKGVPGFRILFGEPLQTYEDILKDVPSNIVIMLLTTLNNELNGRESLEEIQIRLVSLVASRFTKEQFTKIHGALSHLFFGRRYLLFMIVKELKRNHICVSDINDPIHEYNFLIAYLLVIDEVHFEDKKVYEDAKLIKEEKLKVFPLLWAGSISQFEFNQKVDSDYEMFRLLCFSKYAFDVHRQFLKKLVLKSNFKNLSGFIYSLYQIVNATSFESKSEVLKKLVFINPSPGTNAIHLDSLSINFLFGKQKITTADLRKYPLYKSDRGYMIIDNDFYKRKVLKGPLFELHKATPLNESISFEDYKNNLSKDCFENRCFGSIMKMLVKSKFDTFHFDNNDLSKPDLFYRNNKTILLIEFKDYLYPDNIISGNDYFLFRKYIDERFVISDTQKRKGIGQLIKNIKHLYNKDYSFDSKMNELIERKSKLNVFPIICHTDFMFSMPGVNEYLDLQFSEELSNSSSPKEEIKKVTLINLETLFDFFLRGGNFILLANLIDRYWHILSNRSNKMKKGFSLDNFLGTTSSFDEVYSAIFKKELNVYSNFSSKEKSEKLYGIAEITQIELDEEL